MNELKMLNYFCAATDVPVGRAKFLEQLCETENNLKADVGSDPECSRQKHLNWSFRISNFTSLRYTETHRIDL